MGKTGKYIPQDKMVSLIADDYRLLQVLSRFGIHLGFGDKTIEDVCNDNAVDCNTFLTVVNFIKNDYLLSDEPLSLSLNSLLHYLKQSHIYFLEFCLPAIRRKLLDAITLKDSDVSFLILKLFDEYVDGVAEHMLEEETNLFKTAGNLASNENMNKEEIPAINKHHLKVGSKLKELKNIIIKYCPAESNANLLNAALYDIYRCEEELTSHCLIEDMLLYPAIKSHQKIS